MNNNCCQESFEQDLQDEQEMSRIYTIYTISTILGAEASNTPWPATRRFGATSNVILKILEILIILLMIFKIITISTITFHLQ